MFLTRVWLYRVDWHGCFHQSDEYWVAYGSFHCTEIHKLTILIHTVRTRTSKQQQQTGKQEQQQQKPNEQTNKQKTKPNETNHQKTNKTTTKTHGYCETITMWKLKGTILLQYGVLYLVSEKWCSSVCILQKSDTYYTSLPCQHFPGKHWTQQQQRSSTSPLISFSIVFNRFAAV